MKNLDSLREEELKPEPILPKKLNFIKSPALWVITAVLYLFTNSVGFVATKIALMEGYQKETFEKQIEGYYCHNKIDKFMLGITTPGRELAYYLYSDKKIK